MKKTIAQIVILFSVLNFCSAQNELYNYLQDYEDVNYTKEYPFNKAASICFVSKSSMDIDNSELLKGNTKSLETKAVYDKVFLDSYSTSALAVILYNEVTSDTMYRSNIKYNPKHILVFYDKNKKPFTYLEVCFESNRVRTNDHKLKKKGEYVIHASILKKLFEIEKVDLNPQYFHRLAKSIANNKLKFIDKYTKEVAFDQSFELEPDSARHIGRYCDIIKIGSVDVDRFSEQEAYSIIEGQIPYNIEYPKDFDQTQLAKWQFNRNFEEIPTNLIPIYKNGKYGYIDENGMVAIDFIYDKADNFFPERDGNFYAIVNKKGKYGIINTKNETILGFTFNELIFYKNLQEWKHRYNDGPHLEDVSVSDYQGEEVPVKTYHTSNDKYSVFYKFEKGKFIPVAK